MISKMAEEGESVERTNGLSYFYVNNLTFHLRHPTMMVLTPRPAPGTRRLENRVSRLGPYRV